MKSFNEMRAFLRKKTRLSVKVTSILDSRQGQRDLSKAHFQTRDVGAGGMGLETLLLIQRDDVVDLEFVLPSGKLVTASCVIKNVKTENRGSMTIYSAGMAFLKISDADRKAIMDFVGSGDFMV